MSGGVISNLVERYPNISIAASFAGFGTAVLSVLKVITIVGGAAGAIFGAVAGFYSMRCWYRKWKSGQSPE